ncbi:MAG TPA: response regulator transcription factor [Kribbella sp.]
MTTEPKEPIEVVLVEDHPMFRFGLRTRLEHESDLAIVGEAGSGEEALELVAQLAPDVVVIDLNLPGLGGIEVIRRLGISAPRVAPLVLTMLDDESVFGAVRAGARGYLLKDAEPERIVAAIRSIAAGEAVFSGTVAQRLLQLAGPPPGATRPAIFADLTDREHEILNLLADGLSNAAIGQRLGLRSKTVRNYVSNVLTKLQSADRAEAILRARNAGLGHLEG